MEEYLKTQQKIRDVVDIDPRIKEIASLDHEILKAFSPLDEIKHDVQSFSDSLKSFKYTEDVNPNLRTEILLEQQLTVLKDIEQNTSIISNVVQLIQKDVANSAQNLELIKEALEIATSSSRAEAESKYEKLLGKINTTVTGVQDIQTLSSWAKVIYELFSNTFS